MEHPDEHGARRHTDDEPLTHEPGADDRFAEELHRRRQRLALEDGAQGVVAGLVEELARRRRRRTPLPGRDAGGHAGEKCKGLSD